MSSEHSVTEFCFVSYFLFSQNSCGRCAIPDDDVDEEEVDLKVEDGENKKEEDDDHMWAPCGHDWYCVISDCSE